MEGDRIAAAAEEVNKRAMKVKNNRNQRASSGV
jgi:hypothetical protein